LNGEAGDDTFNVTDTMAVAAETIGIDGGTGTDSLLLSGTTNPVIFDTFTSVERYQDNTDQAVTFTVVSGYADAMAITTINVTGVTTFTTSAASATVNLANLTFSGAAFGAVTNLVLNTTGNGTTFLTGSATQATTITGGTGVDTITGGLGADSITGGVGADIIILTEAVNAIDTVIQAALGNSGTFALNASTAVNSISTVGMDVITGLVATDVIALAAYTGTAATGAADQVLRSGVVTQLTSGVSGGAIVANNQVGTVRGTYTASTNVFVGATGGADLLLTYDGDATTAATALEAIVLVGSGALTLSVTAGAGGLLAFA